MFWKTSVFFGSVFLAASMANGALAQSLRSAADIERLKKNIVGNRCIPMKPVAFDENFTFVPLSENPDPTVLDQKGKDLTEEQVNSLVICAAGGPCEKTAKTMTASEVQLTFDIGEVLAQSIALSRTPMTGLSKNQQAYLEELQKSYDEVEALPGFLSFTSWPHTQACYRDGENGIQHAAQSFDFWGLPGNQVRSLKFILKRNPEGTFMVQIPALPSGDWQLCERPPLSAQLVWPLHTAHPNYPKGLEKCLETGERIFAGEKGRFIGIKMFGHRGAGTYGLGLSVWEGNRLVWRVGTIDVEP
ncbi:hypothetical protein ACFQ14_12905 [Pseudahrensia aquimaris]|uniref:Uncharacterized protein n=1 Tax=Pseudahrensia aquimaris TaxID=744461 RepID=A0ABW3FHR4_9HYPH